MSKANLVQCGFCGVLGNAAEIKSHARRCGEDHNGVTEADARAQLAAAREALKLAETTLLKIKKEAEAGPHGEDCEPEEDWCECSKQWLVTQTTAALAAISRVLS